MVGSCSSYGDGAKKKKKATTATATGAKTRKAQATLRVDGYAVSYCTPMCYEHAHVLTYAVRTGREDRRAAPASAFLLASASAGLAGTTRRLGLGSGLRAWTPPPPPGGPGRFGIFDAAARVASGAGGALVITRTRQAPEWGLALAHWLLALLACT